MPDDSQTSRRGALQTIAAVSGAVGCGALAVPTVRFLVEPALGAAGAGRWIKTLPADALPEGEPKRVALVADHRDAWTLEKDVELGAAWLLRKGSAVVAWSTVCPHLGCAVDKSATRPGLQLPLPRLVVRRRRQPPDGALAARARHAGEQGRRRLRPRRVSALPARDAGERAGLSLPCRRFARSVTGSTSGRPGARGAPTWLDHPLVGGSAWSSALAASVATCFGVLALTGLLLMTAYAPAPQAAWASVHYVQFVQHGGWVVRGLHYWAAQSLFVLAAAARRPRRADGDATASPARSAGGSRSSSSASRWPRGSPAASCRGTSSGWWARVVEGNIAGLAPVIGGFVRADDRGRLGARRARARRGPSRCT